ncbi:MAG TPA: hypothetical protein VF178_09095 [Gemmatimonadaceae bacterium]
MQRRSFFATVTAASGLLAVRPEIPLAPVQGTWDLSWLDQLKGRHKQVFDLGTIDDPLAIVKNYLDAHRDVFGLSYPRVNAVVGIAGRAFPINVADAMWQKYGLGERWSVKEGAGGTWATRNIYAAEVAALQSRGGVFWQCNNALNRIARELAAATNATFDAVRADLVGGLLPGVHLVPAHTMALGLAQEKGCTYQRV